MKPTVKPDTRTRLLLAAVKAINLGGESQVNVNKVAKEAGVTVPSVYHFYGSREGLIEEAQAYRFEDGLRRVGVSLDEALARAHTKKKYRDTIRQWLGGVTASSNTEFRKIRTTVLASAVNNPDLAARIARIQEEHVARIASYLKYGIEQGWVDDDIDVQAIVVWTVTQLNGRLIIELDPKKKFAREWDELFRTSVLNALRFG